MCRVFWGFYNVEGCYWLHKGKYRVEHTNYATADEECPEGYIVKRITY